MRSFRLFHALILFCALTVFVNADTPTSNQTISFQGYLTGQQTKMYQGGVTMNFKFYKDADGINTIETNLQHGTVRVNVFEGNYTAKIELSPEEIGKIIVENDAWIEVSIDGTPMKPLIEMTAAPYAMLVKGFKYDAIHDTAILGFPNTPTANPGSPGGLVVENKVLINATNGTALEDKGLYVAGTVQIDGNVTTNTVSANQVFGAIWN
ncbi:MAG: hypothetical protein LBL50_02215 [Candidatus Margulisbacteria bacterium]|jgi:hypothetical protein|nr:hypothetical protein [Candidatus Margulisiibacteriota bacterium]